MKGNKFMRYVTLALLCFVVGMPLVASSDEPASVVAPDPISSPVEVLRGIEKQAGELAQSLTPPSPAPTPAPPIVVAPDFVAITTADGTRIDNAALEKLVTDLPPGEFVALLVPKPGAKLQTLRISIVVQGPQPPPKPAPGPAPPKPTPEPDGSVVSHAYFVFLNRWNDRDEQDELRAIGPESPAWAAIREAGHRVLDLDADSEEARRLYPTYTKSPVLLAFDADKANKFVGFKEVASLAELRTAYKAFTGKELP